MDYYCPFCEYLLSINNERYHYCHNLTCKINYSLDLYKGIISLEEYAFAFNDIQVMVEINYKRNTFHIDFNHSNTTEIIKSHCNIQDLKLQGKTPLETQALIDKICKLHKMRVFW